MSLDLWHTDGTGILTAETARHRLVLKRVAQGFRYLVFQKPARDEAEFILIASGIEATSREAMRRSVASAAAAGTAPPLISRQDPSSASPPA